MNYKNLLKLAELVYNGRKHSSLANYSFSPMEAHFNSHASSEVARSNTKLLHDHQNQSRKLFSNSPHSQFSVGERVFIQTKRSPFYKQTSIFSPAYESDIYTVRKIDKRMIPYVYHLAKLESDSITKKLYAFQMLKIDYPKSSFSTHHLLDISNEDTVIANKKINVIDITHKQQTKLRSGKTIKGKALIFYRVEIDGKQETISQKALLLLKKSIGPSISYGPFFDEPTNVQYKV